MARKKCRVRRDRGFYLCWLDTSCRFTRKITVEPETCTKPVPTCTLVRFRFLIPPRRSGRDSSRGKLPSIAEFCAFQLSPPGNFRRGSELRMYNLRRWGDANAVFSSQAIRAVFAVCCTGFLASKNNPQHTPGFNMYPAFLAPRAGLALADLLKEFRIIAPSSGGSDRAAST